MNYGEMNYGVQKFGGWGFGYDYNCGFDGYDDCDCGRSLVDYRVDI